MSQTVVTAKCQNRRTYVWYAEHNPDPDTGRCVRCGQPATAYDAHADWYERLFLGGRAEALLETIRLVRYLLPATTQHVVDLACGPGLVSVALVASGYRVTGVDASGPMVKRARTRLTHVIHAPITSTGIPAQSTDAVISTWSHTDLPWGDMLDEAHRILRDGGVFVAVTAHPCFVGPHAQHEPRGGIIMHPGYYSDSDWRKDAPGFSASGIRQRAGARHLTMAEFLAPLHDDRWCGQTVVEETAADPPTQIGVRTYRRRQDA